MAQLFINVIGHNASGKTFVSKKLTDKFSLNRVSGDDFRMFLYEHVSYFEDQNNSYPTKKNIVMRPLVNAYRSKLIMLLLEADQSIVSDGSSFTRSIRKKYFSKMKAERPELTIVIIWADLPEPELLERLAERDKQSKARWVDMYNNYRKAEFEPPEASEADLLLVYNQKNYEEIEQKIAALL